MNQQHIDDAQLVVDTLGVMGKVIYATETQFDNGLHVTIKPTAPLEIYGGYAGSGWLCGIVDKWISSFKSYGGYIGIQATEDFTPDKFKLFLKTLGLKVHRVGKVTPIRNNTSYYVEVFTDETPNIHGDILEVLEYLIKIVAEREVETA